ncbi:hypothetical protein E2320_005875 [Naja naja]|nr:hypothetical protein E2320_005875 [Naja naja]
MYQICVTNCMKITDVSLKLIAPLDNIVILNLSGCPRIGDSGIKSFVDGHSASKLKELNLANCSYVSDIALVKISDRCPNLIYLNLHNCQLVTDTGVQAMAPMASLAYLNISRTGISDQVLCTELKKLDYLDLSFCRHISNSTLKYLSLNCRKLTCLILVGCFKVEPTVSSYAPRLQKCEYNDDEPPLWFDTEVSGDELITAKKLKKRRYSTMAVARPSIQGSLGEKDLEQTKLPLIEAVTEQAVEERLISPGSLAEDP